IGLPLGLAEMSHREIDRRADRGASHKRARCGKYRCGDGAGIFLVADFGPVDDDLLILLARPLDKTHRDSAVGSTVDRSEDARIGEPCSKTLALQLELGVFDATGNIGCEDDLKVGPGGLQAAATGEKGQKYDGSKSGSHRLPSCSMPFRIRRERVPRKGF